jgi:uncharacterized membrane protein
MTDWDWLTIARALHVLAVVHWIGGVAMVTLVVLPGIRDNYPSAQQFEAFRAVEGRFSLQAKISVAIAGLAGFYLTSALSAWDRFFDPAQWWMHAMLILWMIFAFVLYVAEPLFLHAKIERLFARDPVAAMRLLLRGHRILLALASITVAGAVTGAHGMFY